jgi:hypothetical protein
MSVQSTTLLENGMQEVTFMKTPIMATYVCLYAVDMIVLLVDSWVHIALDMQFANEMILVD